ncbi:MAG TPA: hypothetical protein VNI84_02770 [Pyrinomonadaceae bacterium]|nr:hypothetical protein [Pyrinomonadaceae bacterium]
MKSLVMTAASNYAPETLRPFLSSLYEHCPRTEVVLIVNPADLKYEAEYKKINENTTLIPIRNYFLRSLIWKNFRGSGKFRSLLKNVVGSFSKYANVNLINSPVTAITTSIFHISELRYFNSLDLLSNKYKDVDLVLLTDSRDVFFQDDPFKNFNSDLAFGLEDVPINKCKYTKNWVEGIYGEHRASEISGEQVICSGVTLGKRKAVVKYLHLMCEEICRNARRVAFGVGYDQGIHNWLVRTNSNLTFKLIPNGEKLIATLNYSDLTQFKFDEKRGLLNQNDELVSIVHQYDRKEFIAKWCLQKWSAKTIK